MYIVDVLAFESSNLSVDEKVTGRAQARLIFAREAVNLRMLDAQTVWRVLNSAMENFGDVKCQGTHRATPK